jgi:hypothetical protein
MIKNTDIFHLGVVGSRTFNDYELCKKTLDKIVKKLLNKHEQIIIVSGGANGADSLAKKYAKEHKIKIIEFLPNWDKHGKAAGFIRNKDIIEKSDILVAFWDGKSAGTLSSIKLMNVKSLADIKATRDFVEEDVKYLNKVITIRF